MLEFEINSIIAIIVNLSKLLRFMKINFNYFSSANDRV